MLAMLPLGMTNYDKIRSANPMHWAMVGQTAATFPEYYLRLNMDEKNFISKGFSPNQMSFPLRFDMNNPKLNNPSI